jgi:ZIP family zinc transporter
MGLGPTLLLGLIAGATILLGLPVGRLRRPAPSLRALLNAVAVGVLLFLVWDVLSAAWEPIDAALGGLHEGKGHLATAIGYGALFTGGLAVLTGQVGDRLDGRDGTAVPGDQSRAAGAGLQPAGGVETVRVSGGGVDVGPGQRPGDDGD